MPSDVRSAVLQALRAATPLEVPVDLITECLESVPHLVEDPDRMAAAEAVIRSVLVDDASLPRPARAGVLPVLGNLAEAVVETMLVEIGWQPVANDSTGSSSGHGVDLLMLDPSMERLVAIEVKSTIQPSRWPRLASGRREQLTPQWFEAPSNEAMVEWGVGAADVHVMVAQMHLRRRVWRACLAADLDPHPVLTWEDLADPSW